MAIDYDDPRVIADAKEKLARLYAESNYQQRVNIGRKLGYDTARTNPDSARRSAERLARYRLGKGSKLDVTSYFRDSVVPGEEPWLGTLPPFVLERGETYYLTAYVAYLQDIGSGRVDAYDGWMTPDFHTRDIRALFEAINEITEEMFAGEWVPARRTTSRNDYQNLLRIGFSEAGARVVEAAAGGEIGRDKTENELGETVTQFGVTLLSSSVRFTDTKLKKDRRAIPRSRASSRDFPKSRRKEMIQYIRRSYGQRFRR